MSQLPASETKEIRFVSLLAAITSTSTSSHPTMNNTTPEQRNFLRKLREARSHPSNVLETSVTQANAATAYLDSRPRRRKKPCFGLMLSSRHLSKLPLSKPILLLTNGA